MTDLEMTKLCAEAMGFESSEWSRFVQHPSPSSVPVRESEDDGYTSFDPLHDDAQAMALVKKFNLFINKGFDYMPFRWFVVGYRSDGADADLNRAIVECVAKMQEGKP